LGFFSLGFLPQKSIFFLLPKVPEESSRQKQGPLRCLANRNHLS